MINNNIVQLFRGKAKVLDGAWVVGHYYTETTYINHTHHYDYHLGMESVTNHFIHTDDDTQPTDTESKMEEYYADLQLEQEDWDKEYHVYPETVGMRFSQKDCKSQPIYTDDILKVSYIERMREVQKVFGIVKFKQGVFYIEPIEQFGNESGEPHRPLYKMLQEPEYQFWVCGNVFDNYDLLPSEHPMREVALKIKETIKGNKKQNLLRDLFCDPLPEDTE